MPCACCTFDWAHDVCMQHAPAGTSGCCERHAGRLQPVALLQVQAACACRQPLCLAHGMLHGSALSQSSSGYTVQATCASSHPKLALCLVRIMLHESALASSPHQAALLESLIALLSSWQPSPQPGQPPQVRTPGHVVSCGCLMFVQSLLIVLGSCACNGQLSAANRLKNG